MGPGAAISIAAGSCPGIVVIVKVGRGVGDNVGRGVRVGGEVGVRAITVCVPERFPASTVSAITVGRYSGGYGVGAGLDVGDAKAEQPAKSPRREARRRVRFIEGDSSTSPTGLH